MKGKAFTKRVALTTVIFAVFLAIAALGGKNATKEMPLSRIDLDIGSILFGARTGRGPAVGTTIVVKIALGEDKEQVFPRGGCLAASGTIQ